MERFITAVAIALVLLPQMTPGQELIEDVDLEKVNNCLVFGPHSMAKLINDAAHAGLFDVVINSAGTLGEIQFLTYPGSNQIRGIVYHDPGSEDLWYWRVADPQNPTLHIYPIRSSVATRQDEQRNRIVGRLAAPIVPDYLMIAAKADIRPGKEKDPESVKFISRAGKKFWVNLYYSAQGTVRPPQLPLIPYNEKPDPKWVTSIKGRSESTPFHFVCISRRCSIPDIIEAI